MQPLFVEMEMAIVMGLVVLVCWSGGHILPTIMPPAQEVPPTVSTSKYYVFDDNGWLMPPLLLVLLVLLVLLSSMHSHSWHHFSFSLLFDGNHGWVVIGDTFKHARLLCLVLSSSLR